MHIRYRQSKLSDNADDYDFAIRTFCSWDHTIFSKEGVKDHRKAFCTELRVIIYFLTLLGPLIFFLTTNFK